MSTHSHIYAWRILWTEEPGGATVHGVTKSQIQAQILTTIYTYTHTHTHTYTFSEQIIMLNNISPINKTRRTELAIIHESISLLTYILI